MSIKLIAIDIDGTLVNNNREITPEVFEAVQKELKKAGRAGQLPSGVVLTGGTAKLKDLDEFAKKSLNLAVRVGKPMGFGGVAESIGQPQFATAVGLMLLDAEGGNQHATEHKSSGSNLSLKNARGFMSKFIDRFKV